MEAIEHDVQASWVTLPNPAILALKARSAPEVQVDQEACIDCLDQPI